MSGLAILCSGQGSQSPGMFDLVAEEPAAAPIFAAASKALGGRDAREIARQGGELIHRNDIAQILCGAAAMAAWAVLGPSLPRPLVVAGYSAGEIPAWAVAGLIDAPTAFGLIATRAALMDRETHAPSGLGAIVGLPRDTVYTLCRNHQLDVAIVNGPVHFIVGGADVGIDAALDEARQCGASHSARLPIHVASHTPGLSAASRDFLDILRQTVPPEARISAGVRLIGGVDGFPVRDIGEGMTRLAAQVSTTIDWAACMEACRAARPARVLELGPGNALARMMKDTAPDLPSRSVSDFRSVAGIARWGASA